MRARRSTLRPVRRVAVQQPSAAPQTCASRISTRSRRAGPTRRSARTRAAPRYAPPCIRSVGRGAAVAVATDVASGCQPAPWPFPGPWSLAHHSSLAGWGLALESRGGIPRTAEPDHCMRQGCGCGYRTSQFGGASAARLLLHDSLAAAAQDIRHDAGRFLPVMRALRPVLPCVDRRCDPCCGGQRSVYRAPSEGAAVLCARSVHGSVGAAAPMGVAHHRIGRRIAAGRCWAGPRLDGRARLQAVRAGPQGTVGPSPLLYTNATAYAAISRH